MPHASLTFVRGHVLPLTEHCELSHYTTAYNKTNHTSEYWPDEDRRFGSAAEFSLSASHREGKD